MSASFTSKIAVTFTSAFLMLNVVSGCLLSASSTPPAMTFHSLNRKSLPAVAVIVTFVPDFPEATLDLTVPPLAGSAVTVTV